MILPQRQKVLPVILERAFTGEPMRLPLASGAPDCKAVSALAER